MRCSGLAIAGICAAWVCAGAAGAQTAEVKLFHPAGPLPAYDVATIKPPDPERPFGVTLRRFIQQAYGGVRMSVIRPDTRITQVVGGPAWIDKDPYRITGKPSEEERAAMDKMTLQERKQQTEMMDQSLLAERFHLKVHFETREMPVYELLPAKHGLKLKPVDALPNGGPMLAMFGDGGLRINGRAMTMDDLIGILQSHVAIEGKPIVNKTGFTGHFEVVGLRLPGLPPATETAGQPEAPSMSTVLEETLGLRLVPGKAPVEVVVIDSIDRPTEN